MKVLVIDDESLIRRSLSRAFKARGHEVVEAADGEQGFEVWKAQAPDVTFVDVLMPKLTGPQLLRRLGADRTGCVIMMSAYSGEDQVDTSPGFGVDHFIAKPFQDIFEVVSLAETLYGKKAK